MTGVTNVVDPLGGSYYVERLTRDLEDEARSYIDTIDRMGGMVNAIEEGFPQREIAESAYRFQEAVERREKIIVGFNEFVGGERQPVPTLYIDDTVSERQLEKLGRLRATRDNARVETTLDG